MEALEVAVAEPIDEAEVFGLTAFAEASGLSLFDAAYLGLAVELSAALASRDRDLLEVARAAGVDVFDLRD